MKVCVYYELDKISADVLQPIGIYLSDCQELIHISQAGTELPDEIVGDRFSLPSERSAIFRNYLMDGVEKFKKGWNAGFFLRRLRGEDAKIIDAVRYEWFFSISEILYPIWLLEQIILTHHPDKIVYVANSQPKIDIKKVEKMLKNVGVEFVFYSSGDKQGLGNGVSGRIKYWRMFLSEFKGVFQKIIKSRHKVISQNWGSLVFQANPCLFIENFPNSAMIAARVAREMSEKGAKILFLVTNHQTQVEVNATQKSILLDDLIPAWLFLLLIPKLFFFTIIINYVGYFWPPSVVFNGKDIVSAVESRFLLATLKSWLRAVTYLEKMKFIVRKSKPTSVVTTSIFGIFARSAVIATSRRTPTFFIQHGLMFLDDFEKYILQTRVFVWGNYVRDWFFRIGFLAQEVFVTGSPKFQLKETNGQLIDNSKGYINVVYFPSLSGGSTLSYSISKRMLDDVMAAVNKISVCRLTIKLKATDFSPIFEGIESDRVQINRSYNATGLIEQADVVIVSTSTVGVEVCFWQKPLIILDYQGTQLLPAYKEFNVALFAENSDEIYTHLQQIINNPLSIIPFLSGQKDLARSLFATQSEDPSRQMADIIIAHMNSGTNGGKLCQN